MKGYYEDYVSGEGVASTSGVAVGSGVGVAGVALDLVDVLHRAGGREVVFHGGTEPPPGAT